MSITIQFRHILALPHPLKCWQHWQQGKGHGHLCIITFVNMFFKKNRKRIEIYVNDMWTMPTEI